MSNSYILLSVATRVNTEEWIYGKQLLDAVLEIDPRLCPERFGNSDPPRIEFVDVESCRDKWSPMSFLWKRSRAVKSTGHVMHPSPDWRGREKMAQIIFEATPDRSTAWIDLFRRFVAILGPKYAMLHLFTGKELVRADFKSAKDLFQSGPPGWALIDSIPNIAWGNFFGEDLSQEVNVDAITRCGAVAERIANGWLVTTSDNIFDVADDYDFFSRQRVKLKETFRPDLFMIKTEDPAEGAVAT
jgi:hypothetical protein